MPLEATTVTGFVLAGNTLLRPLVDWVNRRPLTETATEAEYSIHVTCAPANVSAVRDLLDDLLTEHHYPIRDIQTQPQGDEQVELIAELVPTSASTEELENVATTLERSQLVLSATWSVEATP